MPRMLKHNTYVAERSWYLVALDPIVFVDYAERFKGELNAQDWIDSVGGVLNPVDAQHQVDVVDAVRSPQ